MATIGNVSVKLSATSEDFARDVNRAGGSLEDLKKKTEKSTGGVRSSLKSTAKEVRAFGKELKLLERVDLGGVLGGLVGGAVLGFALSKLDSMLGITKGIEDQAVKMWNAVTGKDVKDQIARTNIELQKMSMPLNHALEKLHLEEMDIQDPEGQMVKAKRKFRELFPHAAEEDAQKELAELNKRRDEQVDKNKFQKKIGGTTNIDADKEIERIDDEIRRVLMGIETIWENAVGIVRREDAVKVKDAIKKIDEHALPDDERERDEFIKRFNPDLDQLSSFMGAVNRRNQHKLDKINQENGEHIVKSIEEVNDHIQEQRNHTIQSLRTPEQLYTDRIDELKKQHLPQEVFQRGAAQAAEQLLKNNPTDKAISSSLFGTQEALSDINKYFAEMDRNTEINDLVKDAVAGLKEVKVALDPLKVWLEVFKSFAMGD
jgi:hypothetical protein